MKESEVGLGVVLYLSRMGERRNILWLENLKGREETIRRIWK
jgi:hypothetical protein